jgi:hypothetical protein
MRALLAVGAAAAAALALVPVSLAGAGDYAFDGGSPAQQGQVRAALEASSFDWSIVAQRVTIHIAPGAAAHATPGEIWLDPQLLDAGVFSWAIVQDEYAHQVDFLALDDSDRAVLGPALGARVWCHADQPGLAHAAYGCERFTSTFVWSFWPASENAYRPQSKSDESAAMDPARFRRLLRSLLFADSLGALLPNRAS